MKEEEDQGACPCVRVRVCDLKHSTLPLLSPRINNAAPSNGAGGYRWWCGEAVQLASPTTVDFCHSDSC